jgi:CBS domain containing-hemolysin-like protein
MYPLGLAFTWFAGRVLKLLRLQPTTDTLMSPDELRMMLRSAEESGAIEPSEQEMIRGIIDLEETVVREVMTPRVDLVAVREDASLADLKALVTEHGYSRLPVYGESIDDVKGVVYARDLLQFLGQADVVDTTRVADIATAAQYVPETLSVLSLLRDMRLRKNHLAVVVDEFGGTAGVITLEDIIEEITGEIYDETDDDEVDDIVPLGDGSYLLQGSAHVENVADALALEFDEDGDYDTVAGFLIGELDRIPQPGESVWFQGVRFTVQNGDERRVQTVLANPEPEPEASPELLAAGADSPDEEPRAPQAAEA